MSKKLAEVFIADYDVDSELQKFLHNIEKKKDLLPSDREPLCYSWLSDGTAVVGIVYWMEV